MKTSLLAISLTFAVIATIGLSRARPTRQDRYRIAGIVGAAFSGLIAAPVVMAGYFALRHAWSPLLYDVFLHNYVPGLGKWRTEPWLPLLLIPAMPPLIWCASILERTARIRHVGAARSVLFLTTTFYWLSVQTLWPLVTRQDWLPFVPMASALAVPAVLGLLDRIPSHRWTRGWPVCLGWVTLAMVVVAEMAMLTELEPAWKDNTSSERDALSELLRLTRPDEPVDDVRGEAIFRPRSTYAAFETVTLARIQRGMLGDGIPERTVATGTAVAYRDINEWPPRGRQFLNDHFISVGQWRVLGQSLGSTPGPRADSCRFEIVEPQRYTIVARYGTARGLLDGSPFIGPRELRAGPHTFRAVPDEEPIAVVWAPAIERGFRPSFAVRPRPIGPRPRQN
jgi:hypothetical protein